MPRAAECRGAPGPARIVRSPWPRSIRSTAPGFRPKSSRRCDGSRRNARVSERTARWVVVARRARIRAQARGTLREIRERGRRARPAAPGMADLAGTRVLGDTSDAGDPPDTRRAVTCAMPSGTFGADPLRDPVTIAPIVTVAPSAPATTAPRGPIVTRALRGLRHVPSDGRFVPIGPASRARVRVRPVPCPLRRIRRSRASCRS